MNTSFHGTIFQSENTDGRHCVVTSEIPDKNLVGGVFIEANAAFFRYDKMHVLLIWLRPSKQSVQRPSNSAVEVHSIIHSENYLEGNYQPTINIGHHSIECVPSARILFDNYANHDGEHIQLKDIIVKLYPCVYVIDNRVEQCSCSFRDTLVPVFAIFVFVYTI